MLIIIAFTITVLIGYCCVLPMLEAKKIRTEHDFLMAYRAFQLRTVKKRYPELKNMSYDEIRSRYNVSDAYWKL